MSSKPIFYSSLLLLHGLPVFCLPQAAVTTSREWFDDVQVTTIPSSVLAAESSEYASYTSHFYATAAPSVLASISKYNALESSLYSNWTAAGTETLGSSESAALASEYARIASIEAVYATYTGNGDPYVGLNALAGQTSSPVLTTSAYVVPAEAAAAPSSTNWPALPQVKAPAAYGVQCQTVPAPGNVNFVLEYCAETITAICQHIAWSNDKNSNQYFFDRWVWSNKGGLGCAMGYWMPSNILGTPKVPTAAECQQTIYGAMTNTCFPNDDSLFNTASVNLAVLPTDSDTGVAVDSGSLSYMIAPHPPDCDPQFPYPCKKSIFQ